MMNVRIVDDNVSAFSITVNGLVVYASYTLADVWNHIVWMHDVASQNFTVGKDEIPVKAWIKTMKENRWLV